MLVGSTNLIFVVVHNATCVLENKNPSCCWGDRRLSLMSEGQRPTSGREKKAIFQSEYSLIHAMVTLF